MRNIDKVLSRFFFVSGFGHTFASSDFLQRSGGLVTKPGTREREERTQQLTKGKKEAKGSCRSRKGRNKKALENLWSLPRCHNCPPTSFGLSRNFNDSVPLSGPGTCTAVPDHVCRCPSVADAGFRGGSSRFRGRKKALRVWGKKHKAVGRREKDVPFPFFFNLELVVEACEVGLRTVGNSSWCVLNSDDIAKLFAIGHII